jgi:hypothetical protein
VTVGLVCSMKPDHRFGLWDASIKNILAKAGARHDIFGQRTGRLGPFLSEEEILVWQVRVERRTLTSFVYIRLADRQLILI